MEIHHSGSALNLRFVCENFFVLFLQSVKVRFGRGGPFRCSPVYSLAQTPMFYLYAVKKDK